MRPTHFSRREMLRLTGQALAVGALGANCGFAATEDSPPTSPHGAIIGEVNGAAAGMKVLADGGNAVDAVVTAALVSCVAAPWQCGIGGYGGHLTLALAGGRRVVSMDFNSASPALARADMFPLDENGAVIGRVNFHGWLAAGVPGTLAGLQLALDRYGSRSFREVVQPALGLARDGVPVTGALAAMLNGLSPRVRADPGMAKLYLRDGESLKAGDAMRNPALAALLTTLAERNSVDSFYRGDLAQRVADGFQQNGGLVTTTDLAAYQAHEVDPLVLRWNDFAIHTAPLTAGGLTVLQALAALKALRWDTRPATGAGVHAKLEALRLAWRDRLDLLGDPAKVRVPITRLLSTRYAKECAGNISETVKAKQPLPLTVQNPIQDGTVHLSCADRHGNLVALTLTHGGSFGAQVAVEELGLTLGHGMSRFNPHPGHPNSPGPGKRPLNNMCPTVVLRQGRPVLALGGAGGVRIPGAIFDVLANFIARDLPMADALRAPRLQCTGGLSVDLSKDWPTADADYLRQVGFNVKPGPSALVSAVSFDSKRKAARSAAR